MQRGNTAAHNTSENGTFTASKQNVFDVAFFEHCTMGDKQLMAELIELFKSQIEKTARALMEVTSEADWRFHTHTLKGAAAAVGAVEIETLANAWENRKAPKRFSEREALRETLEYAAEMYFAKAKAVLA
jgi:HPt (histidine-containing phosphotransfer) domain-containing protein